MSYDIYHKNIALINECHFVLVTFAISISGFSFNFEVSNFEWSLRKINVYYFRNWTRMIFLQFALPRFHHSLPDCALTKSV